MPTYKVDERDVQFNLFEYLNIGALSEYERFKDYNEEVYKMVVTEALKFAKNELDPLYVSGDREQCQINDGVVSAPKGYLEAYKKMGENGFIGIDTPVTYGGQGLPVAMATAVGEFMIGANVAFSLYSGLTRGSSYLIENFGTEELAKRYCEKMYNGTWTGTMCLTEPQAGTAVGEVKTVAKLNDDGTYNIVGNKLFITGGDHNLTENIIHLVLARVEGDVPGTKGLSLFIIPKVWVNDDGSLGDSNDVSCVNIEHKMGIKASATCTLNFGENGKCRGYLLGEQTKGMRIMFKLMNEARLMTGMQGMAIAGSAYENSLTFAKE
ncbi:acyl-CoA dehydrogenase family protein, partial [bacterium]|nr:acyl-CoA dehydrogenase family protein [bacterium]